MTPALPMTTARPTRSPAARRVAVAVAALAALAGGPAWAHEEITPPAVATGTPAFLTLSAANERSADVTRVSLAAASGARFGHATRDPAGWTTSSFSHTEAVWTGGTIRPGRFEQFGFDIEPVAQPGRATFVATLTYADGSTSRAELALAVTAGGAAPAPATTATPATTAAPTTAGPPTTAGGTAAPAATGGGGGWSAAALATSVVALIVAGAALASARRPRTGHAPGAAPPPGPDW